MRIIELISNAAMQLDCWYKCHSKEDSWFLSECIDTLTSFLKDLVINQDVIGGSMFGYSKFKRADLEVHVSLYAHWRHYWDKPE